MEDKELVVNTKTEVALMTELNFEELNTAVEKLGDYNGKLSDKEKEIGQELMKEWETNVLDKLGTKESEMSAIQSLLTQGTTWSGRTYSDQQWEGLKENLAKYTKTEKQFKNFLDKTAELKILELKCPSSPATDPNKTVIQSDLEYSEYQVKLVKWQIEEKKLKYLIEVLKRIWLKDMRNSQQGIDLLNSTKAYLSSVKKYKAQCKDKAYLARLNISISNKETRKALKDIINFTKDL